MSLDLSDETLANLRGVATATLAGVLQKRGIRSTFLSGLRPIKPGQRMIGRARTLRYIPMREDLIERYSGRINEQRTAVEALGPGDVLVIEARNETDAGTIGDIYAMRAIQLGATGIITDGAVRDSPALREMGVPIYLRAQHAATYRRLHMPADHDVPIACAGVTVIPGDVIVGDDEGVVVIPAAIVDEVAAEAAKQEIEEQWSMERVAAGERTDGTFPITAARRPEFEAWLAARDGGGGGA